MFLAKRKAISPLLAGALYVGIISAAILLVVQIGSPAITKMQDIAAIDQAKDSLANFDKILDEVAAEGKGSTRVVPVQIKKGKIYIESANDKVYYTIDTKAEVVSPRTKREIGNLFFSSNTNVDVTENDTDITLENEHLRILFNKTGNSSSFAPMDSSLVIKNIYVKDAGKAIDAVLHVRIDGDPASEIGNGYVYAQKTGTGLARGTVIAHINTTQADYNIYYTLESGGDFFSEISVNDYVSYI